jgi:hypothetical protein
VKGGLVIFAAVFAATFAVSAVAATPVTQQNFLVATTADLVALCNADASDQLYPPARTFCAGFTVRAYRVTAGAEAESPSNRKM